MINSITFDLLIHVSRVDECFPNCSNIVSYVQGIEDKGKSMGKALILSHEEIRTSFSLNPFPLCYEVSFKELKLFLKSLPIM